MASTWKIFAAVLVMSLINSCAPAPRPQIVQPTETPLKASQTPDPTPSLTVPVPSPSATAEPVNVSIWVDERLPLALRTALRLKDGVFRSPLASSADLKLTFSSLTRESILGQVRWTYALATRFASLEDNVSLGGLKKVWSGGVLTLDRDRHAYPSYDGDSDSSGSGDGSTGEAV